MNYQVKYDIGNNEFITAKVFQPLPGSNSVPKVTEVTDKNGVKLGGVHTKAGLALGLSLMLTYLI